MRGALCIHFLIINFNRIIPAYAGSTCPLPLSSPCEWDHPRVCGEHSHPRIVRLAERGSSPRMRGAHRPDQRMQYPARIIPAYAGSTKAISYLCLQTWDHPRVCGEHRIDGATVGPELGSSPRMRGARLASLPVFAPRRIIPAYAGSTTGTPAIKPSQEDHPRVCGEH